jgi:hypothetical protein
VNIQDCWNNFYAGIPDEQFELRPEVLHERAQGTGMSTFYHPMGENSDPLLKMLNSLPSTLNLNIKVPMRRMGKLFKMVVMSENLALQNWETDQCESFFCVWCCSNRV